MLEITVSEMQANVKRLNRKDIANERLGNEIISFRESSDIEETRNLQRRGYNEINQ